LNISSAEGNIVLHLLLQGQEMGQEQLVGQLEISKPAVSRALDSLEAKGFVTRQKDPADRRMHRVRLTGRALQVGPAVERAYNHLYALAVQGIPEADVDHFLTLFGRVSENFKRAQGEENMEAYRAD
jgi:MarR family transcriptional regulator, transcriptional regulator for hemolysin